MQAVLINPYELGRQPFGLAQPAAWLKRAGWTVRCLDLSLQKLDPEILAGADLVAIYVAMHTATRIAIEALPRVRAYAPGAHICVYGLYAPMNADFFMRLGAGTILGGEFEPELLALAERLQNKFAIAPTCKINLGKIDFLMPDRSGLPELERYARLLLPADGSRTVAFAEASRGCKHLCRHCPVVPVYQGRFRTVPVDIVMADIRQQIAAGAKHVSFGDPDFFNGPTHAAKLVRALHAEFPYASYDVTIKIQHLIAHADKLPLLKETGCLFITSAVESVDDEVLNRLDKQHTRADFERAVVLVRAAGLTIAPTFVPFTPWTTLPGYIDLLQSLIDLRLIEQVPPIQLAIRLLIPAGSYLLKLPDMQACLEPFDAKLLGYPWRHADPRVDALQVAVQGHAALSESTHLSRFEAFQRIWQLAHAACARHAPALTQEAVDALPSPCLSEPWYCCAEPTAQQLQSF